MNTPRPIITLNHGHAFTTSLLLAEKFGKKHKNVLRDIEIILQKCPDQNFRRLNFEPTIYQVPGPKNSVRTEKMYNLTRQAFTLVAMGFTGEPALLWKITFINAFDRMEQLLIQAQVQEHNALLAALFTRHPQWQDTLAKTRHGYTTATIAQLQGKAPSSVRQMKQRMRKAGIELGTETLLA